jgi:hypothetical protein
MTGIRGGAFVIIWPNTLTRSDAAQGGLENEAGKNAGRRQDGRQGGGSELPHFHCGHGFSILQINSY